MSTERNDIKSTKAFSDLKEISSTSFYGGPNNGRCLQLTQCKRDGARGPHSELVGFIQVDRDMAVALIAELSDWLIEESDVKAQIQPQ